LQERREVSGFEVGRRLRSRGVAKVSASAISRWETGENLPRDLLTVRQLAEFYGVDPGWLAFGEELSGAPAPPWWRTVLSRHSQTV
jgi:transcriptional regulator with XRE-family HTH domain